MWRQVTDRGQLRHPLDYCLHVCYSRSVAHCDKVNTCLRMTGQITMGSDASTKRNIPRFHRYQQTEQTSAGAPLGGTDFDGTALQSPLARFKIQHFDILLLKMPTHFRCSGGMFRKIVKLIQAPAETDRTQHREAGRQTLGARNQNIEQLQQELPPRVICSENCTEPLFCCELSSWPMHDHTKSG